jgi:hypothetical protein
MPCQDGGRWESPSGPKSTGGAPPGRWGQSKGLTLTPAVHWKQLTAPPFTPNKTTAVSLFGKSRGVRQPCPGPSFVGNKCRAHRDVSSAGNGGGATLPKAKKCPRNAVKRVQAMEGERLCRRQKSAPGMPLSACVLETATRAPILARHKKYKSFADESAPTGIR